MKIINQMRLIIPSKSANEAFARISIAAFVTQLDPTIDEVADIKTAVSEAVTNAIVHGYRDTYGNITVTAKLTDENRVIITVRDSGVGIENVGQAMEPCYTTAPGEERSGMGFTVMETFMDKLRVRSRLGRGTTVTMEKQIKARRY